MITGVVAIVGRLLMRPRLWPTALRVLASHSRQGWWHQRPFLPIPSRAYIGFRLETQYGRSDGFAVAEPSDVVEYLEWVRDWNRRRC